jgi:E3 ubiquitin-protein ligase UBR1
MSSFSSFFPSRLLNPLNPPRSSSQHPPDPLGPLRSTLDTLPATRNNTFNLAVRAQLLHELYAALWGPHAQLFVPEASAGGSGTLAPGAMLGEMQVKYKFYGAGGEERVVEGRPCGHIFSKGESCFRCK